MILSAIWNKWPQVKVNKIVGKCSLVTFEKLMSAHLFQIRQKKSCDYCLTTYILLWAELVGSKGRLHRIEPWTDSFIPPSQLVVANNNSQAFVAVRIGVWVLIHYIPPHLDNK